MFRFAFTWLSYAVIVAILVVSLLSGCATIERHPYITATVVGVVAASVAISAGHHHEHERTWVYRTPNLPEPLH